MAVYVQGDGLNWTNDPTDAEIRAAAAEALLQQIGLDGSATPWWETANAGYVVPPTTYPTGYSYAGLDSDMLLRLFAEMRAIQPPAVSQPPVAQGAPATSTTLDKYLDPWSYSKPRGWENTGLPWPPTSPQTAPTTTVAPTTTTTPPKPSTPPTGGSTGGYSYAGIDTSSIPRTAVRPSMPTGGASSPSPTTGVVSDANLFEQRAKAASLADQAIQATLGDTTGGMTQADYTNSLIQAFVDSQNTNGGSGPSQAVLSPAQVQSLIDTLTAQTATAGQGVGAAYRQADKEMARLMRQYSRAEKMNRAGAQGTLTAFGVRPNAYKVGDFGAPEMLAGARADLIGNKAAEMSNWANQKALYQQLLKDMGG